jgi:hypothetical protein
MDARARRSNFSASLSRNVSEIREPRAVSKIQTATPRESTWSFSAPAWGWRDFLALAVWTTAIVLFFWDAVTLRRALFYFDITEINYPYRAFFAEELRAGQFSRWFSGLYCGLPLFSESQAGYLHPFKYLFYPWLATWQAFNLDTVFSVWLTGTGTFLWLRRHLGPSAALTGAAVFGLSGFMWGHFIHTSMLNALSSVPFVIWGLESSWATRKWRGVVIGALALACQVFAGHLQDALWTALLVDLYVTYRAITERGVGQRVMVLTMALALVSVGVLLSAVQWIPSKELLDRSPRAGGLSWGELTFGSWSPELLPTLVVREAYCTRARDTDWMDGYYPYHEMNAYMGLIAMGLAVVGAGGIGRDDRWTNFWVLTVGLGGLLMLGRFTCLFDYAHRIPVLGSAREPVRFHLWVSLGVAALSAVGVERLGRPGAVSLRGALVLVGVLVALSIPIIVYIYMPVWTEPGRAVQPEDIARDRWLAKELVVATARTVLLAVMGLGAAWWAARARVPARRAHRAATLPVLVIADLLGAHIADVPTVDPRYWTVPPASAAKLKADPSFVRLFALADKSAGEPGYASKKVDFMPVRDTLDWSLPPVWHLASSSGNTPMKSSRAVDFTDNTVFGRGRFDLEGVTHLVTGRAHRSKFKHLPHQRVGAAFVFRNAQALPRARLAGRPVYAADQAEGAAALQRLTLANTLLDHLVVEDPTEPLPTDAVVSGTARIVADRPERIKIEVKAETPAYLVLADTFDPGWSATVDSKTVPIRPAYVAFRAVYLPQGDHTVVFTYRPAGFNVGLRLSVLGIAVALVLWFLPPVSVPLAPDHAALDWPPRWRTWFFLVLAGIVFASAVAIRDGRPALHSRWRYSFHTFTWGAGIKAMHQAPIEE